MKTFSVVTILLVSICMVGGMLLLSSCDRDGEESAGFEPISQPNSSLPSWNITRLTTINSPDQNVDDWQVSLTDDGEVMFFSTQDITHPTRCAYGMHSVALRQSVQHEWIIGNEGPYVGSDGGSCQSIPGLGGGIDSDHQNLYYVSGPNYGFSVSERPGAIPTMMPTKRTDIFVAYYNTAAGINPDFAPEGSYFPEYPFVVSGTGNSSDYEPVEGADELTYHETTPCFTTIDGSPYLLFARAGDYDDFDIYAMDLAGTTPVEISAINSSSNDIYPYYVEYNDVEYLYFSSDRDSDPAEYDIWVSEKVNDAWQTPTRVLWTDSQGYNELAPYYRPDLNEFYFSSDQGTPGHYDIFVGRYE